MQMETEEARREQKHLRIYRILSVLTGTALAFGSLGLAAFAIEKER